LKIIQKENGWPLIKNKFSTVCNVYKKTKIYPSHSLLQLTLWKHATLAWSLEPRRLYIQPLCLHRK